MCTHEEGWVFHWLLARKSFSSTGSDQDNFYREYQQLKKNVVILCLSSLLIKVAWIDWLIWRGLRIITGVKKLWMGIMSSNIYVHWIHF
jgi:hypothetical protein